MDTSLSSRQRQIYEFICDFIEKKGYPPTIREIGAAVGLSSPATVYTHVKKLEKSGLINISPSAQRTISIAKDNAKRLSVTSVPKVGTVAAGQPILAFDDIGESIPLPSSLLRGAHDGEVFILDVKGDSMVEAGIYHGDMIVVHRGMATGNGDIVVARVERESATVKRIFFENGRVRLQPENSRMEPIYAPHDQVEVIGKVIALLRNY